MAAGAQTRDYFVQLMRDNANLCAVGKGEYERLLMERLAQWASKSRVGQMDVTKVKDYQARFSPYFARRDNWSRRDRQEVFELILRALKEDGGYNFNTQVFTALNIFYDKGGCPFDVVSEADYQPLYGSDKLTLFP
jgi:hypothetical protein